MQLSGRARRVQDRQYPWVKSDTIKDDGNIYRYLQPNARRQQCGQQYNRVKIFRVRKLKGAFVLFVKPRFPQQAHTYSQRDSKMVTCWSRVACGASFTGCLTCAWGFACTARQSSFCFLAPTSNYQSPCKNMPTTHYENLRAKIFLIFYLESKGGEDLTYNRQQ